VLMNNKDCVQGY